MYGKDRTKQSEALEWLNDRDRDPTDVPPAWVVKALEEHGIPEAAETFRVQNADWAEGRPRHGEMRSDDHTDLWEVRTDFSRLDRENADGEQIPDECPECGADTADYRHSAHHHIAGSETVACASCGEGVWANHW